MMNGTCPAFTSESGGLLRKPPGDGLLDHLAHRAVRHRGLHLQLAIEVIRDDDAQVPRISTFEPRPLAFRVNGTAGLRGLFAL